MLIRSITLDDVKIIEELNKVQDFKLKDIDKCIIDKIVFEGDKPIAYGIVKRMAEAIILVNHNVPILLRARAMRELMSYAELGAKREGCEQIHVFVKDSVLAKSLVRHFNFRKIQDIGLVKDF